MLIFDRIVVVVLAVGVWALVLSPQETGAHDDNLHSCSISGFAFGGVADPGAPMEIFEWGGVEVICIHT